MRSFAAEDPSLVVSVSVKPLLKAWVLGSLSRARKGKTAT